MKNLIVLFLILFSFQSLSQEIHLTSRIHEASWYKLPTPLYNGVPKYSGPLSTYTGKHIPVAVRGEHVDYYTFSENSSGNLKLYVGDSYGNKTLVHTTYGSIDPHDNAVIQIIDGYIHVVASARANSRIGHAYRSVNRHDITSFVKLGEGWWAYPHLWPNTMLYTQYTNNRRELFTKNSFCDKKLVSDGHYSVSYYDGEWLHLAYNYHFNHSIDQRRNIYYIRSKDGCNWEDQDGNSLSLPLAGNDSMVRIHDSNNLIYMKDISVINDEVNIMVVSSTSVNPTQGTKTLKVFKLDGSYTDITQVGHNYNTGSFIDGEYIITPTFGETHYAAGDLSLFDIQGNLLDVGGFSYKYNYVRPVYNGFGGYVSESPSSITNKGAYIRKVTVK